MAEPYRENPKIHKKTTINKETVSFLILYNDDINTFDYVIQSLIEICDHSLVQAEQCALIAHYKGNCDIKKGNRAQLKELQLNLIKKGLKAGID